MYKFTYIIILATTFSFRLLSQGIPYPLTISNYTFNTLDRLEIKTGIETNYHSAIKNVDRSLVTTFALNLEKDSTTISAIDQYDLNTIFLDNNEWLVQKQWATTLAGPNTDESIESIALASRNSPNYFRSDKRFLKHFYKTPANFWEVNEPFFFLRVNPIFNLELGTLSEEEDPYYFNRRGFEFRGGLDDRIYFQFNLFETQARFPNYVREFTQKFNAIPGEGFIKNYSNSILGFEDGNDFLNSRGVIGFNFSKHAGMQFGYGRNFIGNGYRSLFLSDFSNNYAFLKLNWKVWKFHYQNIYAELSANNVTPPGTALETKKYMVAHYLSFKALKNLSFGVYEAVVFSRENQFELQYLNPLIFYRTVEQALGSPDNVLLGFDFKWNLWQRIQAYGQIIFDEIVVGELTSGSGWWANKFGVQGGLKYIDAFGVSNLDLQVELNSVRPYTYTHFNTLSGYNHYNQPLAHPLGANFNERIILLNYRPGKRFNINGRLLFIDVGEDSEGSNWGGNLLLSSNSREQEYNNSIGQGIRTDIAIFGLEGSYQLAHNVFFDLYYFNRTKNSELESFDLNTTQIGGGIRVNVSRKRFDF